jgi:predicted nucleic acid-binding protein
VPYFVDTNILLRLVETSHPMHADASRAVATIRGTGETFRTVPQNVREFWNVGTRPLARNGLGMSHARVDAEVQKIENLFPVVEDGLAVYREWRRLVLAYAVTGVQVHDAYLVAAMKVHGITHILTFNTADFARYAPEGIVAVEPATV